MYNLLNQLVSFDIMICHKISKISCVVISNVNSERILYVSERCVRAYFTLLKSNNCVHIMEGTGH